MKIIWQIGILFGICLIGEAISLALPISFPGSVISMILLLILLFAKGIKSHHLREESDFLIKNMSILFVPAGVGVMAVFGSIKSSVFQLLLVCILTTIITFGVTALTVSAVIRLQDWAREHICSREESGHE